MIAALVALTLMTAASAGADQISDMRAEAATIATQLTDQASKIVALDVQRRQAQAQLADAQAGIDQTQVRLAAAQQRQNDLKSLLVASAQDAYVTGGSVTLLQYLVVTNNADAGARNTYLSLATGQYRDVIGQLKATREDLQTLQGQLDDARKKAQQRAGIISADEDALNQAVAAQRGVLQQVNGQLATLVAAEQAQRDAAARSAAELAARAQAARPTGTAQLVAPGGTFACIRQLESGNNYASPGGGAYQFLDSTWHALGYTGTASDASPAVQDEAAQKLQAQSGWSPWTTASLCGRA